MRYQGYLMFLLIFILSLNPVLTASEKTGAERRMDGYIQVRYQYLDSNDNGFDIRRARLSLKGGAGPRIEYKLQTELGGTKQKLLDAELNVQLHKAVQLSAGQFKLPFSQENLRSSSKLNSINRSRVVEALTARSEDVIGNQNGRDIGIRIQGATRNSDTPRLEYAAALMNGSGINRSDLNAHKDFIGRVVLYPVAGISIGGSLLEGKAARDNDPDRDDTRRRMGAECTLALRRMACTAEWIRGQDGEIKKEGGYIELTGPVLPDKVQALLKYDIYTPDTAQDAQFQRWTIGFNGQLSPETKLQIQIELIDDEKTGTSQNILLQLQSAI